MNRVKFLFLGMMVLSFVLVGCGKDDPVKPVSYVEDGFYVVGEATAVADLFAENAELALMAAGINEADQFDEDNTPKPLRTGMYEKYVALEGGKSFSLMQKAGTKETQYGATLTKVNLADEEGHSVNEQPAIEIYKGTLTENGTLQVTESGLYHVIVDVQLNTIIIAPVEWGVRGAMNSWGFTPFPKPTFNKTTMTYTLTNVQVAVPASAPGGFKFAYGSGWKIELDDESQVRVSTNLGNGLIDGKKVNVKPLKETDLLPGGGDIEIARGIWKIELTWTLAKGAIKDSYTARMPEHTDLPMTYPENLYMIGNDFGSWDWESDGIVDMVPVNGTEGAFWCINYFTADNGFKWCAVKDWDGDFANLAESIGFEPKDGNAWVPEDGLYLVYIDMAAGKIAIEPAKVFGKGDCFGGWDADPLPFTLNADGKTMSITTTASNNLRMYAAFTGIDWWKMEFNIFDGKIVYRGNGGDQPPVPVDAGKIVTLDFKAGTGTIE